MIVQIGILTARIVKYSYIILGCNHSPTRGNIPAGGPPSLRTTISDTATAKDNRQAPTNV
jgi:hypothetical protein